MSFFFPFGKATLVNGKACEQLWYPQCTYIPLSTKNPSRNSSDCDFTFIKLHDHLNVLNLPANICAFSLVVFRLSSLSSCRKIKLPLELPLGSMMLNMELY